MPFTLVAHTGALSTDASNVTTPAIDTTGADLLVLVVTEGTGVTPADSKSNTWVGLTSRNNTVRTRIWYCNPTSGKVGTGHTFSIATAGNPGISALAFSGAEQVSVVDVENGGTGTATNTYACGSVTPGLANELIVAGLGVNNQGPISSIDSSLTIIENRTGTTNAFSNGAAYQIQTVATARNPTWTTTGNPTGACAVAVFRVQIAHFLPTGATLTLTGNTPGSSKVFYPTGAELALSGRTPAFAPVDGNLQVQIAGVDKTSYIQWDTIMIKPMMNQPSTCQFTTINGYHPAEGSSISIKRGTISLFIGAVTYTQQVYNGKTVNVVYNCTCIDATYYMRKRVPFGVFTNQPAGNIIGALVATYASSYGTDGVSGALPAVTISFDGSLDLDQAITAVCKLAGANHFMGMDGQVYAYTPSAAPTFTISDANTDILNDPPMSLTADMTQIRNRVYIRGASDSLQAEVVANEDIVPIKNPTLFNVNGSNIFVVPASVVSYDGVQDNTATTGALIGYGITPDSPVSLALETGTALGVGVYEYTETWLTPAGETLPAPLATITTLAATTLANPTIAPVCHQYGNYGNYSGTAPNYNATRLYGPQIGDTVEYAVSLSTVPLTSSQSDLTQETSLTPYSAAQVVQSVPAIYLPAGWTVAIEPQISVDIGYYNAEAAIAAGIGYVHCWRKLNGGAAVLMQSRDIYNFFYTWFQDGSGADLGGVPPAANAVVAAKRAVAVTPTVGANGTTSRNIYRTVVGGTQPKLLTTYANNSDVTPYHDSVADGSLGANAPTSDSSGLQASLSNGSGFYTTASVTFSTNGAATLATSAAPSFTSVSYTFVAADVGATLYIQSGTNWTPGRYVIASVVAGAAILSQAIASTASPTNGVWGVDYSTLTTPRYTFSDLIIGAANASTFTSAANPVGVNFIGNVLSVNFSIGFTLQRVVVKSVAGTVATVDKTIGTLSATLGTGTIGGPPPATSVAVGATTIPVTNVGIYNGTGGWVDSGHQLIRYTGVNATLRTLTGIPATGPGSIVAPIQFNTTLTNVSALTGCVGMPASLDGTEIRIFVQRDNLSSQTTLAGIEGGDGIHEAPVIDNKDLTSDAACAAIGDADLNDFSITIATLLWCQRNTNIYIGKYLTANRTSPPISNFTGTIQDVTITQLWVSTGPLYTCKASNVKYTLQDMLAQLINIIRTQGTI